MKRLPFFLLMLIAVIAKAQAPKSFTYQGVARDASGNVLVNKTIGLRLSILDASASVYTETFSVNTNANGMFSALIGNGAPVSGNFFTINWAQGSSSMKELKVEMDAAGGTSYVHMGTTSFYSVPYALVSDKATQMTLDDLTNVNAASPSVDQVLQWNGSAWVPSSSATTVQTNATLSGSGSSASPLKIASQDATSGQVLQWNGTSWVPATISGGVGDNWGTQFVQKNVTLDGYGTSAAPLGIAQQGAALGESMIWNGSVWGPGKPAISIDNVFSGTGTPATPLKLSQQGATLGQVLKWDGNTWTPSEVLNLPYTNIGSQAGSNWVFSISNSSTGIAMQGLANGGTGVYGQSDGTGKGVSGKSNNGIGVYGNSTNGVAGWFDGPVAVFGTMKVFGGHVMKGTDLKLFDQTSPLTVTSSTQTALPGLDEVLFTVGSSASVSEPAKILVTFNSPIISTSNNPSAPKGEGYQLKIRISLGGVLSKEVVCNDYVAGLGIKSFSYQVHHTVTVPGDYTLSIVMSKADATTTKDVTIGSSQVQVQVIH